MKIEFNHYDLAIREMRDGTEFVAIKHGFESDFIEEMKAQGVQKYIKKDEEDVEEDEEDVEEDVEEEE